MDMKVILPQRNSRTDLFFDNLDFICYRCILHPLGSKCGLTIEVQVPCSYM